MLVAVTQNPFTTIKGGGRWGLLETEKPDEKSSKTEKPLLIFIKTETEIKIHSGYSVLEDFSSGFSVSNTPQRPPPQVVVNFTSCLLIYM